MGIECHFRSDGNSKESGQSEGEKTTPVAWEQGCLEEVCGSCSMLVNGKPRNHAQP